MASPPLRLGYETDLTIRNAAAIKAALANRLQKDGKIHLELNPAAAVDLSFVQLLSAARRSARNSGGELTLAAPASPMLRDVLSRAGFIDGASTDDLNFWFHSENAL
jgi:anti-anti-sigma regulatory factor